MAVGLLPAPFTIESFCHFMVTCDSTLFDHVLQSDTRLRVHQLETRHSPNCLSSDYPSFNTRVGVAKRGRSLSTASSLTLPFMVLRRSRMQMHINMNLFLRPRHVQFLTTATMLGAVFLWYSLVLAEALQDQSEFCSRKFGLYAQSTLSEACNVAFTCEEIARSISPKSQVFYPGEIRVAGSWWVRPLILVLLDSPEFDSDISHWANSSSQVPVCSVEPGTPVDVATIVKTCFLPIRFVVLLTFRPIQLQRISRARVPFAVKGGGHTTNPGFSSTPGVHISMTRFNDIVIREDCQTVEIGAGLTWTDVYKYLVPKGLNVVGGRLDGVGVAGLTLGGGECYSSFSSTHSL